MLHPSYSDLINKVNSTVEEGEAPLVQSRYSIVIASAKRARQLIGGKNPTIKTEAGKKPLSLAVEELDSGTLKLSREGEAPVFDDDVLEGEEAMAEETVAETETEETVENTVEEPSDFATSVQNAWAKMFEAVGESDDFDDDESDDDDFADEE